MKSTLSRQRAVISEQPALFNNEVNGTSCLFTREGNQYLTSLLVCCRVGQRTSRVHKFPWSTREATATIPTKFAHKKMQGSTVSAGGYHPGSLLERFTENSTIKAVNSYPMVTTRRMNFTCASKILSGPADVAFIQGDGASINHLSNLSALLQQVRSRDAIDKQFNRYYKPVRFNILEPESPLLVRVFVEWTSTSENSTARNFDFRISTATKEKSQRGKLQHIYRLDSRDHATDRQSRPGSLHLD